MEPSHVFPLMPSSASNASLDFFKGQTGQKLYNTMNGITFDIRTQHKGIIINNNLKLFNLSTLVDLKIAVLEKRNFASRIEQSIKKFPAISEHNEFLTHYNC